MARVYQDMSRSASRARWWVAGRVAAGVLLLAAIGLGMWDVWLLSRMRTVPQQWSVSSTAGLAATGRLLYLPDQGRGVLVIEHLPTPPAGKSYDVWLMKDGNGTAVGLLQPAANGSAAIVVNPSPIGYDLVAVTEEIGQVPAPTATPILVGRIGGSG